MEVTLCAKSAGIDSQHLILTLSTKYIFTIQSQESKPSVNAMDIFGHMIHIKGIGI
jgi:hypothetical protein